MFACATWGGLRFRAGTPRAIAPSRDQGRRSGTQAHRGTGKEPLQDWRKAIPRCSLRNEAMDRLDPLMSTCPSNPAVSPSESCNYVTQRRNGRCRPERRPPAPPPSDPSHTRQGEPTTLFDQPQPHPPPLTTQLAPSRIPRGFPGGSGSRLTMLLTVQVEVRELLRRGRAAPGANAEAGAAAATSSMSATAVQQRDIAILEYLRRAMRFLGFVWN